MVPSGEAVGEVTAAAEVADPRTSPTGRHPNRLAMFLYAGFSEGLTHRFLSGGRDVRRLSWSICGAVSRGSPEYVISR
jgi:hypothetical protein